MSLTVVNQDLLNIEDEGVRFVKINPLDLMQADWDDAKALEISVMLATHYNPFAKRDSYFELASCQLRRAGILLAKMTDLPDLLMATAILSLPDLGLRLRWSCERAELPQHPLIMPLINLPATTDSSTANALAPIYHLLNNDCLFQSSSGEVQSCSLICDHPKNAELNIQQQIDLRKGVASSMLPLPLDLNPSTE